MGIRVGSMQNTVGSRKSSVLRLKAVIRHSSLIVITTILIGFGTACNNPSSHSGNQTSEKVSEVQVPVF